MLNVSYGGFSLLTQYKLEDFLDTKLSLQFPLVSPVVHELYAKVLYIKVLYIKETGEGFAKGVEITSLNKEAKRQLKLLLDINI